MTLIIDMANGTEYQGDDLRCQTRQETSATNTVTPNYCKQSAPDLQLVEAETTANSNAKPEAIMYIDMTALFESNNS